MARNFCLILLLGLASLNLLQASSLRYSFDLSTLGRALQQQAPLDDELDAVFNNIEDVADNEWLTGEDWQAGNEEWIVPLVNDIGAAIPAITDTIQDASNNLNPDAANAVDTASAAVTDAVTNVLTGAGTSVDEVTNTATDIWNNNGAPEPADLANADLGNVDLNDAAQQANDAATDVAANSDDISAAANGANDDVNNAVNVITDAVNQGLDNAGVTQDQAASQASAVLDVASQQAADNGIDVSGFSDINSPDDVTPDTVNNALEIANSVDAAQLTDSVNAAINDASVNSQPQIQDTANTVTAVANSINDNSEEIGTALSSAAGSLAIPLDQTSLGDQLQGQLGGQLGDQLGSQLGVPLGGQ